MSEMEGQAAVDINALMCSALPTLIEFLKRADLQKPGIKLLITGLEVLYATRCQGGLFGEAELDPECAAMVVALGAAWDSVSSEG